MKKLLIVASFLAPSLAFSSDLSLQRLLESKEKGNELKFAKSDGSASDEDDVLAIQPEINIEDGKIKPALGFSANQLLFNNSSINFELEANSPINTDEAEEIIRGVVLDGGDINFNLFYAYKPFKSIPFGVQAGYQYALFTSDELNTDSTVTEIDAEIGSTQVSIMYGFKGVWAKYEYKDFNVSNNGAITTFNDLLDNSHTSVIGLTIPLTQDKENRKFNLKFERASTSAVDKAVFRVSIETAL